MDSNEIKAIMGNRYTIDCSQIVLTPRLPNTSQMIHEGPGIISQSVDGSFSLKMFCIGSVSIQDFFARFNLKAGEIIHEKYYYRLLAKDINGRQWVSDWIMPDIQARHDTNDYIVIAGIRELSYSSEIPVKVATDSVSTYFPGDIDLPLNTTTSVEKKVAGEKRQSSINLNIASFQACHFDFEIEKEAGWLTLKAYSDASISIDDAILIRLNESLQFVLGRSLSWKLIQMHQGNTKRVRVRSCKENINQSRIFPPIQFQVIDSNTWLLFTKYLSYVINYSEISWHPIFRWVHTVIESGCSSLDTQALILSVATEGLLKESFRDLYNRDAALEKQIEAAKRLITNSDLEKSLKSRLLGSLGSMLNPRAKDYLHIFKAKSLIEPRFIEEYDRLRNSTTHGELVNSSEYQDYLDRCHSVLVLFYHIIFILIGYTGPYTDYSEHSFPTKEFKSTLA